jgi:hypothetical protein
MISWTQERGSRVPRPKTGETPIRHVRVEDSLWAQIGEIAREQERSISAVVLDALKRYVTWHNRQQQRPLK